MNNFMRTKYKQCGCGNFINSTMKRCEGCEKERQMRRDKHSGVAGAFLLTTLMCAVVGGVLTLAGAIANGALVVGKYAIAVRLVSEFLK